MPGCWKSEKELFCDTLATYFRMHRHDIGSIDYSTLSAFIDEVELLIYLGPDFFNRDWDDFFFEINSNKSLAQVISAARRDADKLTQTNPDAISENIDVSNLETLLDQNYCVNGIWPGTPLSKAVRRVIKNAQCENTPYAYYYYLLKSYKIKLNELKPINPLKPF